MTVQVNLKLHDVLYRLAGSYAEKHGYRSLQELICECVRERVLERGGYDGTFSQREIAAIEKVLEASVRRGKIVDENELRKALRS